MNIFQSLPSFKLNPFMVLKPIQMVSSKYWKKHQYMNYFRGFDLVLTNQNQDQTTHKQTTKSQTSYKQLKLTAKILTRS